MSIFILGSGPRVGQGIAQKFLSEGYKVFLGSRSPDVTTLSAQGFTGITVDCSSVASIEAAFASVTRQLGAAPNVVVYNAVSVESFPSPTDAFAVPPTTFIRDAAVNIIGAYSALHSAVTGFKTLLDPTIPKVFISTGNILPFKPVAFGTGFVTGKTAQAHLIHIGTLSYRSDAYRFYFASQVTDAGDSVQYEDLSGEAHGKAYWELVQLSGQGEWQVNFGSDGERHEEVI